MLCSAGSRDPQQEVYTTAAVYSALQETCNMHNVSFLHHGLMHVSEEVGSMNKFLFYRHGAYIAALLLQVVTV